MDTKQFLLLVRLSKHFARVVVLPCSNHVFIAKNRAVRDHEKGGERREARGNEDCQSLLFSPYCLGKDNVIC